MIHGLVYHCMLCWAQVLGYHIRYHACYGVETHFLYAEPHYLLALLKQPEAMALIEEGKLRLVSWADGPALPKFPYAYQVRCRPT